MHNRFMLFGGYFYTCFIITTLIYSMDGDLYFRSLAAVYAVLLLLVIGGFIILQELADNPEAFRIHYGIPITRLNHFQKGGRPQGSLSGQNSTYKNVDDALAFLRDAKDIYENKGYAEFVRFCNEHEMKESTVRWQLKQYKDQIDVN